MRSKKIANERLDMIDALRFILSNATQAYLQGNYPELENRPNKEENQLGKKPLRPEIQTQQFPIPFLSSFAPLVISLYPVLKLSIPTTIIQIIPHRLVLRKLYHPAELLVTQIPPYFRSKPKHQTPFSPRPISTAIT
jgi:hypothetical protein